MVTSHDRWWRVLSPIDHLQQEDRAGRRQEVHSDSGDLVVDAQVDADRAAESTSPTATTPSVTLVMGQTCQISSSEVAHDPMTRMVEKDVGPKRQTGRKAGT